MFRIMEGIKSRGVVAYFLASSSQMPQQPLTTLLPLPKNRSWTNLPFRMARGFALTRREAREDRRTFPRLPCNLSQRSLNSQILGETAAMGLSTQWRKEQLT